MKSQRTVRNVPSKRQNTWNKTTFSRPSHYDRDSGLAYDQIEILGPKSASYGWINDFATPDLARTKRKPNTKTGARALHEMVLQKLGIESSDLTVEAIRDLPWTVGLQIWESICSNHTESFYIWRTFATAFGRDFADPTRRYFLDLKSPSLSVSEYQRGITSKDNLWLTCLRMSPKQLAVSDLVSVSDVTNLTVLDLSDGQHSIEHRNSAFDVRVLRSWSDLARSGRAFQNLRVLMLGWQEKIDLSIFEFLDDFPKLRLLIISRCRNFDHKNHRDWEEKVWSHLWTFMPSKRGVKHLRTLLDDKSLYKGKIAGMHLESGRDPGNPELEDSNAPNIPLLEVWLGTPRPWTHITDEFAGTGTIFFRKKKQDASASGRQKQGKKDMIPQQGKDEGIGPYRQQDGRLATPQRRSVKQYTTTSLLAEFNSKT